MKVKITAHVHFTKWSWESTGVYQIFSLRMDDAEHRTYVGAQEIEIDVPDNYDPRIAQIEALGAHKQKVMADYQKTVTDINRRISELQAVGYADAAQ